MPFPDVVDPEGSLKKQTKPTFDLLLEQAQANLAR